MTTPVFTNNLETTIAVTTTASATTIEVADASVFNVLIQDGAGATNGVHEMATLTDGANVEVVQVTNANTGTNIITVVRGQEGTAGYAFLVNAVIEGRLTAGTLDNGFFGRAANTFSIIYGTYAVDLISKRSSVNDGAMGDWSVGIGAYVKIPLSGDYGLGLGYGASCAGSRGIAVGYFANAAGSYALSFGADSAAVGDFTASFGRFANSSADYGSSFGFTAIVTGAYASAFGSSAYARISKTHNISGPSIVRNDAGETDEVLYFSGQENILFSQEYDFTLALADNVITIEIPTGSTFFVSEVGFIPTSLSTITSNPTIELGVNTTTDALMTSTLTTTQTVKKRERYNEVMNSANWVADAELVGATVQLTVSVTTAAIATTFLARVYFKGMLVEDE